MFIISVMKITGIEAYHGAMVIKEKGTVEQYPGCDEWNDDEWDRTLGDCIPIGGYPRE